MSLVSPSAYWGVVAAGTGGTQLDATVGEWVRAFEIKDSGAVEWVRAGTQQRATRSGIARDVESYPTGCEREFAIVATTTTQAPGTQAMMNAMFSEWRRLQVLLSPDAGQVYMKITRTADDDAATISNMLLCEAMELPAMPFPKGGDPETIYGGVLRYPLKVWCGFPFFWTLTAETVDTTSITGTPGTATATNTGSVYCGAKFVVGSVSGTITKLVFSNTTTGDEFSVSSAGFVNGDTIDMGYTDKQWTGDRLSGTGAPVFALNGSSLAKCSMLLKPGANSLSVAKTGGTSCMVTVSWQPCHGSI